MGNEKDRLVTAIVIGCGNRGENYSNFGRDFPKRLKIVAVVEPLKHRRDRIGDWHKVPPPNRFSHWEELKGFKKLADVAIICTQDKDHMAPAVQMAGQGYHLLLEKPMAVTEQDCQKITEACQRGNWRKESDSSFSLMAKCCHDVDLIFYWMGGKEVVNISSFGSLQHFKKEKKPLLATDRCLTCPLTKSCPYSAERIYLKEPVIKQWPNSVVCDIEDDPRVYPKVLRKTLETSPYGRCVYDCDNDVCDTQMVNFMFENGAVANLTMTAFSAEITRHTRITGSLGELVWDGSSQLSMKRGHGGADFFLVDSFIKAVARKDPSLIKSGGEESLKTHMLVFKAEESRKQNLINHLVNKPTPAHP